MHHYMINGTAVDALEFLVWKLLATEPRADLETILGTAPVPASDFISALRALDEKGLVRQCGGNCWETVQATRPSRHQRHAQLPNRSAGDCAGAAP